MAAGLGLTCLVSRQVAHALSSASHPVQDTDASRFRRGVTAALSSELLGGVTAALSSELLGTRSSMSRVNVGTAATRVR